ncbi:MAG: hypothetical protein VX112_03455 [Pseudomonadota bacterium]|nr:hypothetical protein [Pseudomonadota bacterium]
MKNIFYKTLLNSYIAMLISISFSAYGVTSIKSTPTTSTHVVTLVNDTDNAFDILLTELSDTQFLDRPETIEPQSSSTLRVYTTTKPSGIIRFHHNDRPSFSLIFVDGKVYTSYCKDKPSAFQHGMFCTVDKTSNSINLSIKANVLYLQKTSTE